MSRGGRTAAALVAVVVMIGAAVLVRDAVKGDGDDGGSGGGTERPTLACAKELEDVCTAIAADEDVNVVVEPAGETAARLASLPDDQRADEQIDGWLTVDPQPGIVDDAQRRLARKPIFAPSETLARSPLVFVAWKDRLQALANHCGSRAAVTWSCIGDVAGDDWESLGVKELWGDVTLGHAAASSNTAGLLALGQEATSKVGHADLSSSDLDDSDLADWITELERHLEVGTDEGPLAPMLREGPSRLALAEVTEAEACTRLRDARGREQIAVVVPSPVTTADVVYAPRRGRAGADSLREAVTSESATRALTKSGWRIGDGTTPTRVCRDVGTLQLEPSNNVPKPGQLVALLDISGSS